MHRLLVIICLLILSQGQAQRAYLFIKKGVRKVKSFPEGSYMKLQTTDGRKEGYVTMLRKDSVYINGVGFPQSSITTVYDIQPGSGINVETVVYTSLGVALANTALYIVENNNRGMARSSVAGPAVLGFGGLLMKGLLHKAKYGRARYRIGKKFRVQIFDLRPF